MVDPKKKGDGFAKRKEKYCNQVEAKEALCVAHRVRMPRGESKAIGEREKEREKTNAF